MAAAAGQPNLVHETSFGIPFSQSQVDISQNSVSFTQTNALVLLSHRVTTVYQVQPQVTIVMAPMHNRRVDADPELAELERRNAAELEDLEREGEAELAEIDRRNAAELAELERRNDAELAALAALQQELDAGLERQSSFIPRQKCTALFITAVGGVVAFLGTRELYRLAEAGISYLGSLIGR